MEQRDIRDLKVGNVMQGDWPTLGEEDTVERAIKLFAEERISGAPVVGDGKLQGIVTEGDLIFREADVKTPGFLDILGGVIPLGSWEEYREEAMKSAGVTVGEVMTRAPITVTPETLLSEAATTMAEQGVKMLPVVEDERFRGVVTRMDILTLHVLDPRR